MKIIVIFCVFVIQCLLLKAEDSDGTEDLDADELICYIETEVSKDVLLDAKKDFTVPADDPKYKKYLACLWKKYGYLDEDGTINWTEILKVLEKTYKPKIAAKLIEKCNNIEGATEGDTVALVLLCLDEHAPNEGAVHGYYAGGHDK